MSLRHHNELELADSRAQLPNYEDHAKAETLFTEFQLLHTDYAPYFGWQRRAFESEHTNVSTDGERIQPGVTEAGSANATVRFFGGSTIWGTGADDNETIPAYFRALEAGTEVHNHGESGFVSRQNLDRLISLSNSGAKMDWVVFYDGFNDVRTLCRFDVSVQGHSREQRLQDALRPSNHLLHALTGSTVKVMRFLVPKHLRQGASDPARPPSRCHAEPERQAQVIATILGNWRIAREVARLAGAEFLAILQPVATLSQSRTKHLPRDATFSGETHPLVYPALRRAIADADEPWMIDLSTEFDRDEYLFIDAAHVSPNGNRLMAERIHDIIGPASSGEPARPAD